MRRPKSELWRKSSGLRFDVLSNQSQRRSVFPAYDVLAAMLVGLDPAILEHAPLVKWEEEIARVQKGDEGAAQRLISALYPKVVRIIRNHKPSSVDEEDIMQDVFLKVFTKIAQYRGAQPFDHWVARIAVNTCYDRLRQHKARRVLSYSDFSEDEAAFLENALASEEVEASTSQREGGVELLEKLLSTLKPAEQIVIRYLDLEEKSVAEICELTGWGASRVKVTAFRARRKLTATLARLEGQDSLESVDETGL